MGWWFQNFNLFPPFTVLQKTCALGWCGCVKCSEREAKRGWWAYWIVVLAFRQFSGRVIRGNYRGGQQTNALRFLGLSRLDPKFMLFEWTNLRFWSGNGPKRSWIVDGWFSQKPGMTIGVALPMRWSLATTSADRVVFYDGWWQIVEVGPQSKIVHLNGTRTKGFLQHVL